MNQCETRAAASLTAIQAAQEAGQLDEAQALFFKAEIVEALHTERLRRGWHAAELAPLRTRIQSIEAAHGLPPYEYWARGHGPPAWEEAMNELDALLRASLAQTWRECGEPEIAALIEADLEEYQRLREAGRQRPHERPPSLPQA